MNLNEPHGQAVNKSRVNSYVWTMAGLAAIAAAMALADWRSRDPGLFAVCSMLAIMASLWKVPIPKVEGNVSAGFVFVLIAVGQFGWQETVAVAALGGMAQSLLRKRTAPRAIQALFNMSVLTVSAAATYGISHSLLPGREPLVALGRLICAGVTLFLINSIAVAALFVLLGQVQLEDIHRKIQIFVAPYYAAGGVIAAAVVETNLLSAAWAGLSMLPLLVLAHLYYRSLVGAIEEPVSS